MIKPDPAKITVRCNLESIFELPHQLRNRKAGSFADGVKVQLFSISRMQQVLRQTYPAENFLPCAGFNGIDPAGAIDLGLIGPDKLPQQKQQMFIGQAGVVTQAVQMGREIPQLMKQSWLDRVQRLKKFQRIVSRIMRIIRRIFLAAQTVAKNSAGKFPFKEDGQHLRRLSFLNMTAVSLLIIEDQELTGPDRYLPAVNSIPLLTAEYCLQRKTADVIVTMRPIAPGVEDDIVLFKLAEMSLFIEPWVTGIRQTGIIHSGQKIQF